MIIGSTSNNNGELNQGQTAQETGWIVPATGNRPSFSQVERDADNGMKTLLSGFAANYSF